MQVPAMPREVSAELDRGSSVDQAITNVAVDEVVADAKGKLTLSPSMAEEGAEVEVEGDSPESAGLLVLPMQEHWRTRLLAAQRLAVHGEAATFTFDFSGSDGEEGTTASRLRADCGRTGALSTINKAVRAEMGTFYTTDIVTYDTDRCVAVVFGKTTRPSMFSLMFSSGSESMEWVRSVDNALEECRRQLQKALSREQPGLVAVRATWTPGPGIESESSGVSLGTRREPALLPSGPEGAAAADR